MQALKRQFFASFVLSVLLCAAVAGAASAQEAGLSLRAEQWDFERIGQAEVLWEGDSVTLKVDGGAGATGRLVSRQPLNGDFIAQVSFALLDWQSGVDASASLAFGINTPRQVSATDEQIIQIGRNWTGPMDLYQGAARRRQQWRFQSGGLSVERQGQLQILRRGGQVRAAYRIEGVAGGGWQTLQLFDMYHNQEMHLFLTANNVANGVKSHPAVRVRFSRLRIEKLPPLRRPGGATEPTGPPQGWVIYATGPGWLRVGPAAEFAAEQKLKDEIWGGNAEEPLPKKRLKDGLANRADALRYLCDHLTKVHVHFAASSTPKEVVKAIFNDNDASTEDQEYFLRLDRGNDPEAIFAKGQEYDLSAEKKILNDHGLTPRVGFRKQWLIHAIGHGTVDGDVKDDRWMLHTQEPQPDPKNPGTGTFIISDGFGGTIGYRCDKWEGPYRDNYGLARAMKRLQITELELYPPAGNYSRRIAAGEVPENPRDHGTEVLGVQPIVDPSELQEWVVYTTGDAWLHIGTRAEFENAVKARETVWAGNSDETMKRVSIPLGKRFFDYRQALDAVCKKLTAARVGYFPTAQPREAVRANLNGKEYLLHLARDPDAVIAGYGGYDLGAEVRTLLARGIRPSKRFKKQWLVHATGHGTYSGDVKDDLWMMVGTEPKNGGVTIPDGQGGTFGYKIDVAEGPFKDSISLINALKARNLKSIGLYAEDRSVSVDEVTTPPPAPEIEPQILSIAPDKGEPEQSFYVTLVAKGMKPGYRFRFGPGITVTNETNLGKNPDGEGERWLATITVDKAAKFTGS